MRNRGRGQQVRGVGRFLCWGIGSLAIIATLAALQRLLPGQPSLLSRSVAVSTRADNDNNNGYRWLSDHELLLYQNRNGWLLRRLDLNTGVETPLIAVAQGLPPRSDTPANMAVSSDGHWLLWRNRTKRTIVTARLDGTCRYTWNESVDPEGNLNVGLPHWQNDSRHFVELITRHSDNFYRTPYIGAALIRDVEAPNRAEVVALPRVTEFEPNSYFEPPYVTADGNAFSAGEDSSGSTVKTLLFVPLQGSKPIRKLRVHAPTGLKFDAPTYDSTGAFPLSPHGDRIALLCVSQPALPPFLALLHPLFPSLKTQAHLTFSIWISRPDGSEMRELGAIETVYHDDELLDAGIEDLCWLPSGNYLGFAYHHTLYRVPIN